ncbi:protoporphyrinogen oxidase [Granulicella mallensis]|uniref:Coproporphyrinogen III oxidase n=1 Tax=Granulicella mallensis TaxID=940614 RepID=A0A7W8E831_9BACT|nr:protoporphyrinogen oxidase [Granulicella mallensis]MBB5062928.1 oxygen-dependent protoporphyrinogen oxidase [Granulicella mallensis]
MKRIAIIGGGIAGLTAAYELELARKRGAEIDWHLYEAGDRLGGIVETTQSQGFVLEGGPDGWVSEKPWARELALELGLGAELISSNDATRKTYILIDGKLQPMPDGMRMMVPENLSTLEDSPLFSDTARKAYAAELERASELRSEAPEQDESVASFILRHFGEEVLTKIGAPLLSGVFGGDVKTLSVRAVMPNFITMEREYGSLIAALQAKAKTRGSRPVPSLFTTLRNGLGTLIEALVAQLPPERLNLSRSALSIKRQGKRWLLRTSAFATEGRTSKKHFHHVLFATPIDATRALLTPLDAEAAALIPTDASSAVLAALCWPAAAASTFSIPQGFGFLVPQARSTSEPQLLAATFVDQKFPDRAPAGARVIRVFFGGPSADTLSPQSDETIAAAAFAQLTKVLGPLPAPDAVLTTVRRWPRSLPQYEVGHLERMVQLDLHIAKLGDLTLLGNGYRGVGLPDLIRDARAAARELIPTA